MCWTCGANHGRRDFPHLHDVGKNIYSAQEVRIVGEVALSMPQIYSTMENFQVDHQDSIIEMEGKLQEKVVSILINQGSNYSYVNPELVEKCGFGQGIP